MLHVIVRTHRDRNSGAAVAILRGCVAAFSAICPCSLQWPNPQTPSLRIQHVFSPDKSVFNLFNPVPEDMMRELAATARIKPTVLSQWMLDTFRSKWISRNLTYNGPKLPTRQYAIHRMDVAPVNIKSRPAQ